MLLKKLILIGLQSTSIQSFNEAVAELMCFDDFRHFSLKAFNVLLTTKESNLSESSNNENCFHFLAFLSKFMPKTRATKLQLVLTIDNVETKDEPNVYKQLSLKNHRKRFEQAWLNLLNRGLSKNLIKNSLFIIHSLIIPNVASPCLLSDFLSSAYDQGGGLSVLSLHGLFVLMTEHNLEYPDFYTKLYSLVNPQVLAAKYAPRFFHLLNIFLASTHLPAYLAAAFIKRLSRLMLTAPTNALHMLIPFILNLVKRHGLNVLLDKNLNGTKVQLNSDPYIEDEDDPLKSKALDSSLWELQMMTRHYDPQISMLATITGLPAKEVDINELLETTNFEYFENSTWGNFTEAPMNINKPKQLFGGVEDSFAEVWNL